MPDFMDRLQADNANQVEDALKRHHSRPTPAGRATCANLDCGEPISDVRRKVDAQLCLPCQRAEEAQAVHLRRWKGR